MTPSAHTNIARAIYRSVWEIDHNHLTTEQSARWLIKQMEDAGLDKAFRHDLRGILIENRRQSRKSNHGRYGKIPYHTICNQVHYNFSDIKSFWEHRLKPLCEELERQRIKSAERAGLLHAA